MQTNYRIAGNFRWCKFSYELPICSLNIRTAQHSDVEHKILCINYFHMMLYDTKYTKISTVRKLPTIRYLFYNTLTLFERSKTYREALASASLNTRYTRVSSEKCKA